MPLYSFVCPQGHNSDQYKVVEERNDPAPCPYCAADARRVLTPAGLIVRPAGYSLRPGDKGYWDFETPQGRKAPWERRQIEPFAKEIERITHPAKIAGDDEPVVLGRKKS